MTEGRNRGRRLPRNRALLLAGWLVAFLLAGFISGYASSSADGLEKVAADQGIDAKQSEHGLADFPSADYAVSGVDNEVAAAGLCAEPDKARLPCPDMSLSLGLTSAALSKFDQPTLEPAH